MKDRVVQYPHRYQLVPVAGETNVYDFVPVTGTITEAGTPLNKATLLKDETATLYGLTGEGATVDGAFMKAVSKMDKQMINQLLMSLQLSLNSNNIDAWSDLLSDDKGKLEAWGVRFSSGSVSPTTSPQYLYKSAEGGTVSSLGKFSATVTGFGIRLTDLETGYHKLKEMVFRLRRVGNPTGQLVARMYTGFHGTDVLFTSTPVDVDTIAGEYTEYVFAFPDDSIFQNVSATIRSISIEVLNGTHDASNYIEVARISGQISRQPFTKSSGTWNSSTSTTNILYVDVVCEGTSSVIWKSESTIPLKSLVVVTDSTLGEGDTIDLFVSNNKVDWVQLIEAQMQDINFVTNDVFVKSVLLNNAKLDGIAWGGR